MNGWLRYIGAEANKVLSALDLSKLGAWESELVSLGENKAIAFVKNVAQHVEPNLAQFIADHPTLAAEFQTLSDEEAAAEVAKRTTDPSRPAGDTSTPSSPSSSSADAGPSESTSDSSSASGTAENVEPAAPAKSSD